MGRFFLTAAVVSLLAVLTIAMACGGDTDVSSPTGIEDVDIILSAIETGDAPALMSFLAFRDAPCERYGPDDIRPLYGHGTILCTEDEATGELVPTYWSGACEGSWWERSDAESLSDRITGMNLDLYAVYEDAGYYPVPAQHVAIFAAHDLEVVRGFGLYVNEGRITGIEVDCGFPPAKLVKSLRLEKAVLSPDMAIP